MNDDHAGFTLVELSIVLVVIGLIVGGVLTGQDLIRAGEIRSTVSKMREVQAAFHAFKNKYNCIPGDCSSATTFFGAATQDGDGDTIVESAGGGSTVNENNNSLVQLALAGTISYDANAAAFGYLAPLSPCIIYVSNNFNLYGLQTRQFNAMQLYQSLSAAPWANGCLLPRVAKEIDLKIDEGNSGRGLLFGAQYGPGGQPYTDCLTGTNPWGAAAPTSNYDVNGTVKGCLLQFRL